MLSASFFILRMITSFPEDAGGGALHGSIPFGGRYRLIDFTLSSMANAGIDNVSVIVRKNYHSLMDHLGAGREWDLTRKRGGLNIVPPFAERSVKLYSGRVDALDSILNWLEAEGRATSSCRELSTLPP